MYACWPNSLPPMVLAPNRRLDALACACAKPAHPEQPGDLYRIVKIGCTQLGRGDIVDLTNVVFARRVSCNHSSLERFHVFPDEAGLWPATTSESPSAAIAAPAITCAVAVTDGPKTRSSMARAALKVLRDFTRCPFRAGDAAISLIRLMMLPSGEPTHPRALAGDHIEPAHVFGST